MAKFDLYRQPIFGLLSPAGAICAGSGNYTCRSPAVPAAARITVFDSGWTLWSEQPIHLKAAFAFDTPE